MKVVALSTLAACVALQTTAAADLCRETIQCKTPGDDTCFLVSGDCPPCLAISPSPSGLRLCVTMTTLGMCPLGYVSCNGSSTTVPPPTPQPVTTTAPPTSAIPWTTTAPVVPPPTVTFPTSVLPPVTSRPPVATSPVVTTSATATKSPEGPATLAPLAPSTTTPLNLPTSTTAFSPQDYNESSIPTTNSTSTMLDTASSSSGPSASWTAAFVVGGIALALLIVFVARKYRKSHEDDDDEDACTPDAPLTFTGHSSFQPMQRLRTTGSEDEPVPMMPPIRPSAFSKPNNDFVARTSLRNSAADTPPRASVASSMDFEINAVPSPVYTDSSRGNSAVDLWDEMPILISQKQSRMQPTTHDDHSVTL